MGNVCLKQTQNQSLQSQHKSLCAVFSNKLIQRCVIKIFALPKEILASSVTFWAVICHTSWKCLCLGQELVTVDFRVGLATPNSLRHAGKTNRVF